MNHLRVAFRPLLAVDPACPVSAVGARVGSADRETTAVGADPGGHPYRADDSPGAFRVPGRPPKDRAAMARALVAKAVYDMPTTRVLLDRLDTDVVLRRICGWERRSEVPSESVFSRAFAEFSDTQLPQRVHEALIWNTHRDRLVGHLSRDSTAIEAREKPAAKEKAPPPPKRKRGRLKKGEERPKVLKRLDRQATMSLPAMLDDLPTACDVGMKRGQQGLQVHLGRLQAAHRRGRRPDSDQLPADVRLAARQPSRHSAGDVVGRADDQSV